jgi:hypothetical protein
MLYSLPHQPPPVDLAAAGSRPIPLRPMAVEDAPRGSTHHTVRHATATQIATATAPDRLTARPRRIPVAEDHWRATWTGQRRQDGTLRPPAAPQRTR